MIDIYRVHTRLPDGTPLPPADHGTLKTAAAQYHRIRRQSPDWKVWVERIDTGGYGHLIDLP